YFGVARSPDVLNPPRMRLVLVDHNEAAQAVGALDEADLVEVLDHHRLGNPPTNLPIPFTTDPVGSTSTLVSERMAAAGLQAPAPSWPTCTSWPTGCRRSAMGWKRCAIPRGLIWRC